MKHLLQINNLQVYFNTLHGRLKAVRGIDLEVEEGEIVALVGESGCGKTTVAFSILNLLNYLGGRIECGNIFFEGIDLLSLSQKQMQKIRGNNISMIFQDPFMSLNPVLSIGCQITEVLQLHQKMNKTSAKQKALELLSAVKISDPETRINQYPHQLSGGMRQRVCIAMALCCNPKLLIADEPTTAVDVTIQAQIINLLKELNSKFKTAILLITHDLGLVANLCKKVFIMYAGKIVESGIIEDIYYNSKHPYTSALLRSIPKLYHEKDKKLFAITGQAPDLTKEYFCCSFYPRCEFAMPICKRQEPTLLSLSATHKKACFLN